MVGFSLLFLTGDSLESLENKRTFLNWRGKNLGHGDLEVSKRRKVQNRNFPCFPGKNGTNSEERGIYTNPPNRYGPSSSLSN